MPEHIRAPLRTQAYWGLLARSALIGAFGGVFAIVFLTLEHLVVGALWGDLGESFVWFSGGIKAAAIPVVAGAIVGGLYIVFRLPRRLKGFLEELEEGYTDPAVVPGAVLISFVSLGGGAALGPEAPLVTAASGFANKLIERSNPSEDQVRTATFTGAAGVLGGLFSSPFIGTLFAFEVEKRRGMSLLFDHLIPGGVAGVVAFAIVYPTIGSPFLGLYDFPAFEFRTWHLLAGVGLGVVGAIVGLMIGVMGKFANTTAQRLPGWPVAHAIAGGVILGVLGFIMPATMFSGIDALEVVLGDPAALGAGLILAVAALKAVSLSVSLSSGFYGGPFFPMFFIGGSVGAAVHLAFPNVPLALGVGAVMAATGGISGVPFSVALIGIFIVGVGVPSTGVIMIAVITSVAITHGLGIVGPWSKAAAQVPDAEPTE